MKRTIAALSLAVVSLFAGAAAYAEPARPWHEGAVLYGVVPPPFGDPPLKSVTARLDQLRALGVDALWLSPVQATDDPSAISYAITDYFALRADFGTPEDLKALVRAAHARGMRVLLDFVPNHTSTGHPFYRDAEGRGRRSPYHGYYQRERDGTARYEFNWEWLRNLSYDDARVRRMVQEAFTYWVTEFDVDGFRVDAAWGVRQRAPEFWPQLARALRRIKPDPPAPYVAGDTGALHRG